MKAVTGALRVAMAILVVLISYAVGGTLAAFGMAVVLFCVAGCGIRAQSRVVAPSSSRRFFRASRSDSGQHIAEIVSIDARLNRALYSRRAYDHGIKPELFQLATVLLASRRASGVADESAVRAFIGEELWPLVDPAQKSFADVPRVEASEVGKVLARIEELA